jgi:hypothetical protein
MSSTKLIEASKFLSYVLRHEPQAIGLSLDSEGWGSLDAVIAGATQQRRMLSSPFQKFTHVFFMQRASVAASQRSGCACARSGR